MSMSQGEGYQGGLAAAGGVVSTVNVNANVNASVADGAIVGTTVGKVGESVGPDDDEQHRQCVRLVGSAGLGR